MDEIIIKYGSDIAKLQADLRKVEQQQLNIDKGAKKSGKTIKDESEKAAKGVEKLDKNVNGLDATFKKVGGAIAGVFAVGQIISTGKEIIRVTAEFQKFEAVLTNTLGSKSQAQAALAQIKEFAASTPFGVAELTSSFVKLANQGFKPTAKEMTKLGDIAASQGKSFDQLTEGLIDAQTGEFERLKEFGIRASKEGDNVKFTFKGVETQTKFTNDAIRDYVLSLGDAVGVSGSMAAISQTVGGQISNLDDSFDSLFNTIGSGNSGVFKVTIEAINSLVQGLEIALLTQEQLQKKLDDMESSARKNQYFGFLEKDIKSLTQVTETEAEARGLVLRNEIIFLEKELAGTLQQIASAKKNLNTSSVSTDFLDQIKEMEKEAQFTTDLIKEIDEQLTSLDKREAGASKKTQEQLDKEFKLRLDLLKKQEEISVRRAKLEDKTEGDIIKIHEKFNGRRIGIFNEFNKQQEIDYQDLLLKREEFEKEYSEFLKKEGAKRIEEAAKYRELLLGNLDKALKEENNLYAQNFNLQLDQLSQRYIQGQINREQFESESAAMAFEIQKDATNREIDLIESKLDIENLSYEQRIGLEEELLAKRKELGKVELDEFKRKEDEKAKKDKETQDKIEKRQKQVIDAVQRGVDLAATALNGLNELRLAQVESVIEEERSVNEKRQEEQLANLTKSREAGIISERQFAIQKDKILKDAAKKESELKRRQYEAEQKAAINRVNIDTAVGIAKTIAQMGFIASLPVLPFIIANGEIQKALIRAQPVPKFKDGVIDFKGKGTQTSDSNTVQISNRESVIKAKQSIKHKDALTAIQDDYFSKYADINFVQPALKKERERARTIEEREKASHDYMKSLSLNGLLDTTHLERLTKKNKSVKLENVNELLDGMERIMKPKSSKGL